MMGVTLLTPKEAAKMLSCSVSTVRRMVTDGQIVGYMVRPHMLRVDYESVEEHLGNTQVVPAQKIEFMGYTPGEKLV